MARSGTRHTSGSGSSSRPRKKRRRRGRRIVAALGVVVVVLAAGVWLLGPTIAAPIAAGLIEKAVGRQIVGSVRVSGVALSWTGEQRVGSIQLRDPLGGVVGEFELDLGRGLVALARGSRDLGDCTLSGRLDLTRDADGSTNLQRAIRARRAPSPSAKPASLPAGFALGLEIDQLAVELTDDAAPGRTTTVLIDATINARAGGALEIDLAATITEPGLNTTPDQTGSIELVGEARGWSDRNGTLTPDDLDLSLTLTGNDLPTAAADRLGRFEGRLVEALGDRLAWAGSIQGSRTIATIAASADAPLAHASASVRIEPGMVELTEPAQVELIDGRAVALVPALAERFEAAGQTVTLDARPTLTLRVDQLAARFDQQTGAIESIAGEAVLSADAMAGTITTRALDSTQDQTRRFAIDPITARVRMDEAGLARLTTSTTATMDALSAGTLHADLAAADLLAGGTLDGRAITGTIELAGLDTQLIEPFATGTGVRIATDIGPTLDSTIALTPGDDGTRIEASIGAQQVVGRASLVLGQDRLATRGDGIAITARRGGTMLAALLEQTGEGLGLRREGTVSIMATDLDMPIRGGSLAEHLEQTRAQVHVRALGLVVRPPDQTQAAEDLSIERLALSASIAPDQRPRLTFDATMNQITQQGTQLGTLEGELTMASLASVLDRSTTPAGLGLEGTIELAGLSHRLAGWMPGTIQTTSGERLDLAELASQLWGPTARATLEFKPTPDGATRAIFEARGQRGRIDAAAGIFDDRVAIESATITGELGLHAFRNLAESFGPAWNTPPRLSERAPYELRVEPMALWLGASTSETPILRAHLTMPEATVIGLSLRQDDGSIFRPGPTTASDLRVALAVPIGTDRPGSVPPTTINADLRLADRTGQAVGEITAAVAIEPGVDDTTGAIRASAQLKGMRTAWVVGVLESLTEDADLLPGTIGDRADLDLTYRKAGDRQTLGVTIEAPNLRTLGAMELAVEPTRLRLTRPVRLQGELAPEVLTRLALDPDGPVAFDRPTPWTAQINRLDLSRAPAEATTPGEMSIEAGLAVPQVALDLGDGQSAVYNDLSASIASDPGDTSIVRVRARASRAIEPADQPTARAVDLDATIMGLDDDSPARVSLTATLDRAPTALLDALLDQGGVLADTLGPQASATIRATNLSRTGGTLDATLDSPLARGRITGRVGQGVLELNEPASVRISQFGPGLMRRLSAMSPVIGSIEKRPQDGPATLTIDSLRMPTDGDLRKLDAQLTLDIGAARFQASEAFAPLMGVVNWRTDTTIGQRLEPLVVSIDDGVASTAGFALPLGEFVFESRGSYDLVTRDIDVVVLIPLGLLSDDVARSVQRSTREVAGVLGQVGLSMEPVTKIPFRLRGPIAAARPQLDAQLLVDEFLGDQLKPEKLIERGAEGLLRGLFGDKPKNNDGG